MARGGLEFILRFEEKFIILAATEAVGHVCGNISMSFSSLALGTSARSELYAQTQLELGLNRTFVVFWFGFSK